MKFFAIVIAIVGITALVCGAFALSAFLFEVVWNFVMPAVFKLPIITFWQAAGIVFLLGFIGKVIHYKKS